MVSRRTSFRPSRTGPIPRVALALVLLLGTPLCGLGSQDAPEIFVDTVDVEVVNVEVVVTDRSGAPVRGLTRDDFVILEDGEPVEVTNFYAVESARRVAGPEEEAPVATPVTTESAPGGTEELPEDQRLNLVVLVDNLNIRPTSRSRILDDLGPRLDGILRTGDRVLVAAASPEVRIVQPLTADLDAVGAALSGLRQTTSRGDMTRLDARAIRREIDEAAARGAAGGPPGGGFGSGGASPEDDARATLDRIRAWAANRHTLDRRLLATLDQLVRALGGLPGRRAVLYVSEGFPVRPAEALIEDWFQVFSQVTREVGVTSPAAEAARWDATSQLVELTETAAGHHVTFYTLETGSVFHDGLDPESRHPGAPTRTSDIAGEGALTNLAWRTGGSSLLNSGTVGVLLDQMATDYREYYSLGYVRPEPNDGEYHAIEVEVPGRKVRVRHTQGYHSTTQDQQTVERTLSALVFDVATNPLDVRVEVGEETPDERDRFVVPVLVRVPIASLTLIPSETVHRGRLSVVIAVQDDRGRLSEPQRMEVPVEIPNERLLQSVDLQIAKGMNLLLRAGESKLAVGVRDELSGTRSALNLSLAVGDGE